MMNTFGNILKLTSFGESHGFCIGGVIDGYPANIDIDIDFINYELSRRKPGQSKLTSSRKENDTIEILSGVFEGKSTGCPIGFIVKNNNQISNDYQNIKDIYRPSHSDFTYNKKYGIMDYNGGGRASARETITRCVGGAFAKLALNQLGIKIYAYTSQIGQIKLDKDYNKYDLSLIENNIVRCPDENKANEMVDLIELVKSQGDTIGGIITCVIKNCPIGLGEPIFGKLNAQLASAMLSINACKGFEIGKGFDCVNSLGSKQNDIFINDNGIIKTKTNNSGGIQGGISNGQDIYFRVAFKPVPTILKEQNTINTNNQEITFKPNGRHDPCVIPRAVPIVESMAALVILDNYLINKTNKL